LFGTILDVVDYYQDLFGTVKQGLISCRDAELIFVAQEAHPPAIATAFAVLQQPTCLAAAAGRLHGGNANRIVGGLFQPLLEGLILRPRLVRKYLVTGREQGGGRRIWIVTAGGHFQQGLPGERLGQRPQFFVQAIEILSAGKQFVLERLLQFVAASPVLSVAFIKGF
jgi:hypothetical protein